MTFTLQLLQHMKLILLKVVHFLVPAQLLLILYIAYSIYKVRKSKLNYRTRKTVHNIFRLKKINPMFQSCRTRLFFGVRLIQQNSRFFILFLLVYFFPFSYEIVKIYKKRYDRHSETLWTTDFFNSVFCLVSCSSKNQVTYFKAVTDSNLTRLLLRKKKKKNNR